MIFTRWARDIPNITGTMSISTIKESPCKPRKPPRELKAFCRTNEEFPVLNPPAGRLVRRSLGEGGSLIRAPAPFQLSKNLGPPVLAFSLFPRNLQSAFKSVACQP